MSQWTDRITNHPVWASMESLGVAISSALESTAISSDAIDTLERIREFLNFSVKRLSSTSPSLVAPQSLDTLNGSLAQIKAYVESYTSNGDMTTLNTASNYTDSAINNVAQILGTKSLDEMILLNETSVRYRNTILKYLKESLALQQKIEEKNAFNEGQLSILSKAIATEQSRLSTLLSEQQSLFSAAQDKRASDFAVSQTDFQTRYTTALTEQLTQFSTDQDSRRTAYSEFQVSLKEDVKELLEKYDQQLKNYGVEFSKYEKSLIDEHNKNLSVLHNDYESSADNILIEMREKKMEIESLIGVIGTTAITYGYKKVADEARRALYVWQTITVVALVGLIVVAYFIAFPMQKSVIAYGVGMEGERVQMESAQKGQKTEGAGQSNLSVSANTKVQSVSDTDFYHGLITRIFLSITFGVFAAYASRQASRFFSIEQKNRKLALELEALGPFIEPLSREDRDKFRVQVGDRSFGVPDHDAVRFKDNDPVSLIDLLQSKEAKELISNRMKEIMKDWNK